MSMMSKSQIKSLVGKQVYVQTRDGRVMSGILDKMEGDKIYLQSVDKKARTSAFFNPITTLALFDILALSTTPFFFGFPFFF